MGTLVVFAGMTGLIYATTVVSSLDLRDSRGTIEALRADRIAESGLERARHLLFSATQKAGSAAPLNGIRQLFSSAADVPPGEDPPVPSYTAWTAQPMIDNGSLVGAYSVQVTLEQDLADSIIVTITSSGYVPDAPQNLGPLERLQASSTVSATLRYMLRPSEVFDNGYFINNWGWFYGDSITCNGNARSNGQFDAAGYSPTVTGQPVYERADYSSGSAVLSGYSDDNGDGLSDGNDGGIFSGWDIVGAGNVQGNGGSEQNQHDFEQPVDMPNLSDLSSYEQQAIEVGSSIQIDGTTMAGAVFGDDPGETGNLYLHGTEEDPIVIDGPVVVQGDLIISGYVTGQGAIYTGGNLYVPDSIQYVNGPASPRPADNTQAATEEWLTANQDADLVGLFSKEHVVIGDHTDSVWRYYVSDWMASPLNESSEDSGEDGIPGTIDGLDGIANTADDDHLESDGIWTTLLYTEEDAALGLIPLGMSIGDPVPGTGEDIDGDGEYDDRTEITDIDFSVALDESSWGGNMPTGGIADYSDIATLSATNLDAIFYTNHSFSWVVSDTSDAVINGAVISRNENIVYGTPALEINYDARLLGGSSGIAGDFLPTVLSAPQILRWQRLEEDPLRYLPTP